MDRLVAEGSCRQTEGPRKTKMISFVKAYADTVAASTEPGSPF